MALTAWGAHFKGLWQQQKTIVAFDVINCVRAKARAPIRYTWGRIRLPPFVPYDSLSPHTHEQTNNGTFSEVSLSLQNILESFPISTEYSRKFPYISNLPPPLPFRSGGAAAYCGAKTARSPTIVTIAYNLPSCLRLTQSRLRGVEMQEQEAERRSHHEPSVEQPERAPPLNRLLEVLPSPHQLVVRRNSRVENVLHASLLLHDFRGEEAHEARDL